MENNKQYINKKFVRQMVENIEILVQSCNRYTDFYYKSNKNKDSKGHAESLKAHNVLVEDFQRKYSSSFSHPAIKASRYHSGDTISSVLRQPCWFNTESLAIRYFPKKITRCKNIVTNNGTMLLNRTDIDIYSMVNSEIFVGACEFLSEYGDADDKKVSTSYLNCVMLNLCVKWKNSFNLDSRNEDEVLENSQIMVLEELTDIEFQKSSAKSRNIT